MTQSQQPWLAALRERLEDGRTLFRESFDLKGSYDRNGVLESSIRFTEAKGAEAKVLGTLEVVAAKADIINRNRRLYSKKVFELATGRAQALVSEGDFLGEVDHPWLGTLQGAAIRWTKVWMEGAYMKAEGVILKTDKGQHLKALLDGGVGVKISTRGYASYTLETRELDGVPVEIAIIGEDYTMEGIDAVLFPSNPAGRVVSHENSNQPEVTVKLTLEQLKQHNADLVAQIEASAREGFVAQAEVEKQVNAAKEAGVTEGVEKGKKEALADATVKQALIIAEAVKGIVTPKPAEPATESEKKVATLSENLATVTAQLDALKTAQTAREADEKKATTRKALEAKVEETLKGYAHAELLKADLLACESVELVAATFAARKTVIETAIARAAVSGATGKGTADTKTGDKVELTEAQKAELADANHTRGINGQALLTEAQYAEKYIKA